MARTKHVEKDHIITIATFYDPFRAHILKTRLESEGIQCLLADGNLLPTVSFFTNEGGVKLKIRREDLEHAREIIVKLK